MLTIYRCMVQCEPWRLINPLDAKGTSMAANIFEKAVAIAIEFHQPGNTRKVDATAVEVECDRDMLSVNKRLLDSDEFRAVKEVDRKAAKLLKAKALPSFFKTGVYLLPVDLVESVEKRLTDYKAEREEAVKKFIDAYPSLVEAAKDRLKDLYDASEYPEAGEVAKRFGMAWQYVDFGVPGKLSKISKAIFEKEQQKAEQRWNEASVKIQDALRTSFAELVRDMTEKLEPGEDGKKRTIQGRSVEKIKEFLADFASRNITDDKELSKLVGQAEALLEGKSVDDMRKDELFRQALKNGFGQISGAMGEMVTLAPKRVFKKTKEEAEASDAAADLAEAG